MAELREVFDAVGVEDARTYLQSGNVVFRTSAGDKSFGAKIEKALRRRLGLDVSVLLRTDAELARVVARNPFAAEKDGKKVHVAFLDAAPARGRSRTLDPDRVAPDAFHVAGREVYLRYPTGYGRSKLTNDYLEKQLQVRSTMRNWKTVTALAERAAEGSAG
jgi:uncharacterized protein (DUF1697 family)